MPRLRPIAALAALLLPLLLTGAAPAAATEAQATTSLNVRTGPGTQFRIVDVLAPGEWVEMRECQSNGWCYITHDGPDGWVSSNYLTGRGSAQDRGPDCQFRLVIGPDGPRFSIICGDGGGVLPPPYPRPPYPPRPDARACFHTGPNFTGARFCSGPGLLNRLPAGFENRVTSVRLEGGARVRLCEGPGLSGYCHDFSASVAHLGPRLNNRLSSARIFSGTLPRRPQACFYDAPDFGGAAFCRGVGTLNRMPPGFDDRISSVRVWNGAQVRLCQDPGLGGFCRIVTMTTPMLGPVLNNRVSSLRVR